MRGRRKILIYPNLQYTLLMNQFIQITNTGDPKRPYGVDGDTFVSSTGC